MSRPAARGLAALLLAIVAGCGSGGASAPTPVVTPTPSPAPTLPPVTAPGPPYQRGPAPSASALEAELGPFAVGSVVVERAAAVGYGGATLSYPVDTREGPFAAVVVVPGLGGLQRSLAWLGPRLASHGFVVSVIDTLSPLDTSDLRAVQLVAALNHAVALSASAGHPLFGKVDGNRLGVTGHSLGGGAALVAGTAHPSLRAVVPLAPFSLTPSFPRLGAPTLVLGCERDVLAPVASHAIPIYQSLPAATPKAYLELAGGDHLCVETGRGDKSIQGKYVVAWLKRFLDDDVRYSPYLCGAAHAADLRSPAISGYRESCPY